MQIADHCGLLLFDHLAFLESLCDYRCDCAEEVFFPLMPLTDVDRFVTSSGALRVKAEILFHLCAAKDCELGSKSGAPGIATRSNRSDGDGLQLKSDGLQPRSDGLLFQ